MEAAQKEIIRQAVEHLKSSGLDIDGMIARLNLKKIITPKQMGNLLNTVQRSERLDKFAAYMQRKGTVAIECLKEWFETNVDQMTYKKLFGSEQEKKEFAVSDDDDDGEDDNQDEGGYEGGSEDDEVDQPPLKKQKSIPKSTCAAEAQKSGEGPSKLQENPINVKGKNKKIIKPAILKKAETIQVDKVQDQLDHVFDVVKKDPLSGIFPLNKTQRYRLHMGRSIFATAGEFQGKFYFHVRRFGGDKMYPGLGVAFTKPNFEKFMQHTDELEFALTHSTFGVNPLQIDLDNNIRLSIVDNKLDIRKMHAVQEADGTSKMVFTRCGVRISLWQFTNLLAVIRKLDTLIPGWQQAQ